MTTNRWWDNNPDEIYWLEITDRDDLGNDLNAPQKDDKGHEYHGYSLINEIRDGDIIFHYHKKSKAIEACSQASGHVYPDTVVWGARGTTARKNIIQPYSRPGWRLDLKDFHFLESKVTLEQLRTYQSQIENIQDELKSKVNGSIYFPFEISITRPLRPTQAYLTKLPKNIVFAIPTLKDAISGWLSENITEHNFNESPVLINNKPNYWIEKTHVKEYFDRQEGSGDYELGKVLWYSKGGPNSEYISNFMTEVQPGDVVLHFVDNREFQGVSRAKKKAEGFSGVEGREVNAYLVELEGYRKLDPPLQRDVIFKEEPYRTKLLALRERTSALFYRNDFHITPFYLTPAPLELIHILNDAYKAKTGRIIIELEQEDLNAVAKNHSSQSDSPPRQREIDDEPLACVAKENFDELVKKLRYYLLVDERIIHRIYRALLAGHIILTGPPGTGKTILASYIPEILWSKTSDDKTELPTAYTTHLVTATDEWSVHTLISGIHPHKDEKGQLTYDIRWGYLTKTLKENWSESNKKEEIYKKQRVSVYAPSKINGGMIQEFRGRWLIIDEFNRAPIDIALGEALTTLSKGNNEVLYVYTGDGQLLLPIPKDFRIIGTLNSFDRNHLYQISEALKRRFFFIDIPIPTRQKRKEEIAISFNKALERVEHLAPQQIFSSLTEYDTKLLRWENIANIVFNERNTYEIQWLDNAEVFKQTLELAWDILEVIRIYRQIGTAQAIDLIQHLLIASITRELENYNQWIEALDDALCDTISDQLHVLLPDELNVIFWYISIANKEAFVKYFKEQIIRLKSFDERRFISQIEALGSVVDENGHEIIKSIEVEEIVQALEPTIDDEKIHELFHLQENISREHLIYFTANLKRLKFEKGL